MYGAFIGDIVGSKYEFNNIKTKTFPLFSAGCNYTDDSIMTTAVAKAILLSYDEQLKNKGNGKGFQEYLVEVMQNFGRKYPNPTGAYGGNFAKWLRQNNPKPYGSYGNGSAMRVSPCGLIAVTLEEALELARASACVTHNHPEGIKGAEAVSAAIFLAKCGNTKEEIKQYINDHYYNLNFTLDSIRDNYNFDGSCQGSVPQAIVAFLESENFEDAIRNVISIGGDCDTTGAITGSIAWIYYAGYGNWVTDNFDISMQKIKNTAMEYLPKELIDIANKFSKVCGKRAGSYHRVGGCTSILSRSEIKKYRTEWKNSSENQSGISTSPITKEIREAMTKFCDKYLVLMEVLFQDKELNQWCRNYSAYRKNTEHCELEKTIYDGFMREAYKLGFMPEVLSWKPYSEYTLEAALNGTELDLLHGICLEIRSDYGHNGSLISHAIAEGNLYRLMSAFISYTQKPQYTLEYIKERGKSAKEREDGVCSVAYDQFTKKWRLKIQLDNEKLWYLSVFVCDDGRIDKYSLDKESACDSHFEFADEQKIRNSLYVSGDESKYLHQIMRRCVKEYGGEMLRMRIMPYVTQQYHFD